MKNLFTLILCVFLLSGWNIVLGQLNDADATWSVVDKAGISDLSPYHQVLQSTDLTAYRQMDSRRVLKFKNGLKVELLSVRELIALGIPVNEALLPQSKTQNPDAVFSIKDGYLIEQLRPVGKIRH